MPGLRRCGRRFGSRLGLGLVLASLRPAAGVWDADGTPDIALGDARVLLQQGLVLDRTSMTGSQAYVEGVSQDEQEAYVEDVSQDEQEAYVAEDVSEHLDQVSQHLEALADHLDEDGFSEALSVDPNAPRPQGRASSLPPQQQVFLRFDTDGSGGYNREELAQFLQTLGRRNMSEEGLRRLWKRADLDGDSEIDIDELADCVVNPASCYHVDSTSVAVLDRRDMRAAPRLREQTSQGGHGHHGRRVQRWRQSWVRSMQQAEKRMRAIEADHDLREDGSSVALNEEEVYNGTTDGFTPKLLQLHLMPDKGLRSSYGAVCLDGSPAGFYFASATNPEHSGKWIIMLEGGAWCASVKDCLARSYTGLGSSKNKMNETYRGGLLSDNCQANPHFCGYNRVIVFYCDGSSFTGNRNEPIIAKNESGYDRPLYFRGKHILDAVLDTLLAKHDMDRADHVLLAGCSAGGLSALVHADYVKKRLHDGAPLLSKFRTVSLSGFFLKANNVDNKAAYPAFLYRMVAIANSTSSLNKHCLGAFPTGKRWNCIFPEFSLAYTSTPVFLVNSALDWWSGLCVLFPEAEIKEFYIGGNGACGMSQRKAHYNCANNVERCTPFEMYAMNQFIRDFSTSLSSNQNYMKAGNGAFIHSCHTHCEALMDESWPRFTIDGTRMNEAVLRWWHDDGEPASTHFYKPCEYKQGGPNGDEWPYQCNPSCADLPS